MARTLSKEPLYHFVRGHNAEPARAAYSFRTDRIDPYWLNVYAQMNASIARYPTPYMGDYHYVISIPYRAPIPYVRDSFSVDMRQGWNASGDTAFRSVDDFVLSFDYARYASGGIILGVSAATGQTYPTSLDAAVFLRDGAIEVLKLGQLVATAPYTPDAKPLITLMRNRTSVTVQVGDWAHTVITGNLGLAGARGLLYRAGDYIDNPSFSFVAQAKASGTAGFKMALSGTARARATVGFRLKTARSKGRIGFSLTGAAAVDSEAKGLAGIGFNMTVGTAGATGMAVLRRMLLSGGDVQASNGSLSIRPPVVRGDGGFYVIPGGGGVISMAPLEVRGAGLTGAVANLLITLPALAVQGADRPYGQALLALPRIDLSGRQDDTPPGHAELFSFCRATLSVIATAELLASITERVGVSVDLSLTALFSEDYVDGIALMNSADIVAFLSAQLIERVQFSDSLDRMRLAAIQYATNVLTGAVTRYEGFDFLGFANVGMDTYAAADDGIYRVEHNHSPITAAIEFATVGIESGNSKRLDSIYLGLSSDGNAFLRVTGDDKQERVYMAVDRGGMRRGQMAKGVQSRHWNVRLEIVAATFAELDRVEWLSPISAKRHGR
jgi:hypothetical protein